MDKDTAQRLDAEIEGSDPEVAHSPLGPSSGERWMECTASVQYTAGMPDTESIFAAEGTAAHTLSEWVRETGKPAKSYIGKVITVGEFEFEVDGAMAAAVQRFVDYCDQWPGDAFYEERVHYTAWVPNGWGTADDIRIDDDEAVCYLTDLKFGKGVKVFAENNPQLKLYALGVFQDFGHLYDIKEFRLAIHQPRLDHIDEWTISVKDLLIWARDEVVPRATEALTGEGAVFKAGPWCRFCSGRQTCAARTQAYQDEFMADLEEFEDVNDIPNWQLAELLGKVAEIRAWCSDIEARALSEVQKGNPVGDYKLVAGRTTRYWKDAEEAEKALRGVRKLKVADILPAKLVSPAQAEKLLGKGHPVLEELITSSPGKPVLVPGSDPRPPLQVNAEDEFEDLDEAE